MNKDELQVFFERYIPFNLFLGMKLVNLSDNLVTVMIPFRPEFIGDPRRPALHGGVISTLLDTAGGGIAFSALDWKKYALSTIDMRVDYLLPGRPEDIYAEASVLRKGNRVIVTTMRAFHASDRISIAEGRAVYNISRRTE